MYTKSQLISQIESSGIKKDEKLLIHSSMKAIGEVEGGAETVIDAFMEYLNEGLLVFPTHTWKQMNDDYNIFNPKTEPSCVGILTNLFMKRENVYRSLHPTHSVAACGKNAADYVSGEEKFDTPCPRKGCWGKLYDMDAKILFLGCSLRSNTIIHGVEEWNGIPHRLTEKYQELKIVLETGKIIDRPVRRHDSPNGDVSANYGKIEDALMKRCIAQKGKIGDAESLLCDVRQMVDLVSSFLKKDPDLFIDNREIPEKWY